MLEVDDADDATTAAVLLLGATGVHQARTSAAADLARAERLAAVQLGTPTLGFDRDPPARDTSGRLLAEVQLQALNAGDEPVELTPVATSVTAAELLPAERPVRLAAEQGGLLVARLAVDCGAVPPRDQLVTVEPATGLIAAGGGTSWVRLAVGVDGERAERRYLLPDQPWAGGLTEQLASACTPDPWSQDVSASTEVDVEGRLRVSATNRSEEPARAVLVVPTALRASTEPSLPADVPAGGSLQLLVSLAPDCALTGQEPGAYPLQADVSLDLGQGSTRALTDTTVTTAWVARQVALRCG